MVQKIMPKIVNQRTINRSNLKAATGGVLAVLAGSSMSGGNILPAITKDMIIPGGLSYKEKAYYLLTGEFSKSVKDRLEDFGEGYSIKEGDQIVNLTVRGEHIEFINSAPHGFDVSSATSDAVINKINIDYVIAVGPMPMMRAVAELTRPYGIKTEASMNPIMVDGTGMCGACRLTVGGEVKFACVDGPDFDAHLIDFDEVINRTKIYKEEEKRCDETKCNLIKKGIELEQARV